MKPGAEEKNRRSFLGVLVGAISALVGTVMAVPLARLAIYPMTHGAGEADWFALGKVTGFSGQEPIRVDVSVRKQDGWRVTTAKQMVWVTRNPSNALIALSAVCTHLGCVVPWNAEKKVFICPCHNGVFAKDGARVSGPPPRGLDALPTKIEEGVLYVKYQYYRQLVSGREVVG